MIKPALTPEEWAARSIRFDYAGKGTAYLSDDGDLGIRNPNHPMIVRPPEQHTLAALCLHGQPFGFTREDVETLRGNCAGFKLVASVTGAPDSVDGEIAKLLDLADRIEALLPPEEPK